MGTFCSICEHTLVTTSNPPPELRRELNIFDLALAQILIVIVPEFFGTAAKAGRAHGILWLLAILTFFIPQALVVSYLNRLLPLEGGLFEWSRHAFGNRIGFLVAWNMWLNTTVQVSQIGLITTTYLTYAFGSRLEWLATNPFALASTSVLLILGMMIIARLGLGVGKWLSNAGSFFTVLILVVLAAIPFFRAARVTPYAYHPLPLIHPPLTLFTFSVFSKMTFGALTGFELVAIFAGESRNPARNLARSILFTAPLIALLYILGTSSILAYVSPDSIDVIGPIPQALSLALSGFAFARFLVPVVILLLLTNYLSSYTLYFSTNTRLPLVAGWDQLLPRWFSVLHPKYRTPVNSILFVGAVALVASIAASIGSGNQEAFVLLQIWSWTFYGLAYLGMFAIPLFGKKMFTEERSSDQSLPDTGTTRPAAWLRLLALSGFLITLLFVALSIFPIVDVISRLAYSMKIVLVVLGANLIGWLVYRAGSATAQPPSGERVQPTA